MKINSRIQFNLHTKGKAKRFESFVMTLGICLLLGHIHWHPQFFQALWILMYVAGTDFVFDFSKLELLGMASNTFSFFKGRRKSDFDKYAAELETSTPAAPPADLEIHFLSNPHAPNSWKEGYAVDTEEGKAFFLKRYWALVKEGRYGGYKG